MRNIESIVVGTIENYVYELCFLKCFPQMFHPVELYWENFIATVCLFLLLGSKIVSLQIQEHFSFIKRDFYCENIVNFFRKGLAGDKIVYISRKIILP